MSINYPVLFQQVGSIVSEVNTYDAIYPELLTGMQAIVAQFGSGSTTFGTANLPIVGLNTTYSSFQSQVSSFRSSLAQYAKNAFTNYDTVTSQLPVNSTNFNAVVAALMSDMVANHQTVKASVVAIAAPTYGSLNIGNASIVSSTALDGYTSPRNGVTANQLYAGVPSELVVPSETLTLICTSDSSTNAALEGGETWSVVGAALHSAFDSFPEGSGTLGSVQTANNNTALITGTGFDIFGSGGVPNGWSLVSGTPGVNILQETTNTYGQGGALKIAGDGSTAVIAIQQKVRSSGVHALQMIQVTVQACRSGSAPGGGTLTIQFQGTGYTAAPSEQISVGLAGLGGAYGLYKFYLLAPSSIPSDLTLLIQVNGTPTSGSFIYLDSMSASPVYYRAGINLNVLRGTIPAIKGDVIKLPISNNGAGLFSMFAREALNVQLPSTTLGNETIQDGWAT